MLMKKFVMLMAAMMTMVAGNAETPSTIKLKAPDLGRGANVMKAFESRHSEREFADRDLSMEDLSDLMWAAYGINRSDGRHTAASAMNRQDVDVYVVMKEGAYLYVPVANELKLVADGDHRNLIAGRQKDFPLAPVSLVIVSDLSRFGIDDNKMAERMGAIDAGLVSQNIALFCAGTGLVTVPRATMDTEGLRNLLGLKESAVLMLNNPVGYPVSQ